MAYLINRTQGNFTMIQNNIFRDTRLKMADRGLLCTMMSLPDGWEFSISGMASIVPEGKDAIQAALKRLKALGYVRCYQERTEDGRLGKNVVEVFSLPLLEEEKEDPEIRLSIEKEESFLKEEADAPCIEEELSLPESPGTLLDAGYHPYPGFPDTEKPYTGNPSAADPSAENRSAEKPSTETRLQYNKQQYQNKESKTDLCIHTRTKECGGGGGFESDRRDYWLARINDILSGPHEELGSAS